MPGKLPIDRVRENEQAPRILEREKGRYAKKRAKLRKMSQPASQTQNQEPKDAELKEEHDNA